MVAVLTRPPPVTWQPKPRSTFMKARLIATFAAILMITAACGAAEATAPAGSSSTSGSVASLAPEDDEEIETAVDADLDSEAQLLLFAECIRDQGFDIADPTIDADGNVTLPRTANPSGEQGPAEGFREARDACAEHLEGVTLGFRGGDQTELQDQLLEFSSCMRDNGFDLPDPDFADGGARGLLQQVDQNDPDYQAAFATCGDILGGFGQGGARGTAPGN